MKTTQGSYHSLLKRKAAGAVFGLAVAALLAACAMNTSEEAVEGWYTGEQYPERSVMDRSGVLGFGYDLTGEYAQPNGTRYRVLDYAKLNAENKILPEGASGLTIDQHSGTSIHEYSTNVSNSITVSASGGYGPASFSAEASHAFSKEKTESSLYAFSTIRALAVTNRYRIDATPETLQKYLSSEFAAKLTSVTSPETAQDLIALYGTHVMLGGVWGGRVDYNYSFQKKEQVTTDEVSDMAKVKAEGSLGVAKFGGGVSNDRKEALKQKFNDENFKVTYYGVGGTIGALYSGFANEGKLNEWANSLTPNNAYWIDFFPGPLYLRPLYEFIADAAKRTMVQNAITNYFNSKKIAITTEAFPAPGSSKGTINANVNLGLEGGGYRVGGGDSDINSKNGRETNWSLSVAFQVVNKRTVQMKTWYTIRECAKNNTELQIYDVRNIATADHDIVLLNGGASIYGSGRIGGKNHGWISVGVAGLSNVQIKIDGSGDDEKNMGFKFTLNNIPYTY